MEEINGGLLLAHLEVSIQRGIALPGLAEGWSGPQSWCGGPGMLPTEEMRERLCMTALFRFQVPGFPLHPPAINLGRPKLLEESLLP